MRDQSTNYESTKKELNPGSFNFKPGPSVKAITLSTPAFIPIPIKVNGQPVILHLDTLATNSILSTDVADALQLRPIDKAMAEMASPHVPKVEALLLEPATVSTTTTSPLQFSFYTMSLSEGTQGILGQDLMAALGIAVMNLPHNFPPNQANLNNQSALEHVKDNSTTDQDTDLLHQIEIQLKKNAELPSEFALYAPRCPN